jgi:hypothetical protein
VRRPPYETNRRREAGEAVMLSLEKSPETLTTASIQGIRFCDRVRIQTWNAPGGLEEIGWIFQFTRSGELTSNGLLTTIFQLSARLPHKSAGALH